MNSPKLFTGLAVGKILSHVLIHLLLVAISYGIIMYTFHRILTKGNLKLMTLEETILDAVDQMGKFEWFASKEEDAIEYLFYGYNSTKGYTEEIRFKLIADEEEKTKDLIITKRTPFEADVEGVFDFGNQIFGTMYDRPKTTRLYDSKQQAMVNISASLMYYINLPSKLTYPGSQINYYYAIENFDGTVVPWEEVNQPVGNVKLHVDVMDNAPGKDEPALRNFSYRMYLDSMGIDTTYLSDPKYDELITDCPEYFQYDYTTQMWNLQTCAQGKYFNTSELSCVTMPITRFYSGQHNLFPLKNPADNWLDFNVPDTVNDQAHFGDDMDVVISFGSLRIQGYTINGNRENLFDLPVSNYYGGGGTDSHFIMIEHEDDEMVKNLKMSGFEQYVLVHSKHKHIINKEREHLKETDNTPALDCRIFFDLETNNDGLPLQTIHNVLTNELWIQNQKDPILDGILVGENTVKRLRPDILKILNNPSVQERPLEFISLASNALLFRKVISNQLIVIYLMNVPIEIYSITKYNNACLNMQETIDKRKIGSIYSYLTTPLMNKLQNVDIEIFFGTVNDDNGGLNLPIEISDKDDTIIFRAPIYIASANIANSWYVS